MWAKIGVSVTADDTTAPDGNTTADLLTESAVDEGHRILQTFTTVSGTTYALSAYVKANGRDFAQIFLGGAYAPANSSANFDLVNSTVTQTGGGIISAGIEAVTQGFFRIHVTFEATASASGNSGVSLADSGAANYAASYPGDGTSGIYIWGAQLEEGSFPTSYIPTAGTQVTRAADDCVRVLGDEYNVSEGTLIFHERGNLTQNGITSGIYWGSKNINRISKTGTSSDATQITLMIKSSSTQFNSPLGSELKWAISYKDVGDSFGALNGEARFIDSNLGSLPAERIALNQIGNTNFSFGNTYKSVRYIPRALSEAELITLTGGT